MTPDPLALFLPPVAEWFRRTLGQPTPVQREGWPSIAAGRSTLLLAPTGSGKTLASFLACLDHLWRQTTLERGVRILYVSPLKALNNDIHRNLQAPLLGVAEMAREMGVDLPTLEAAVRTGDTPQAERLRLLRKPPHILITTPESLHLLLTSKARAVLGNVTHLIVDEIHALCPNKRGVFLSLLCERLEALNPVSFVRIGLSATQRPLDEVARFLGGSRTDDDGRRHERPVTIVDTGLRKNIDLRVVSPVEQFGPLPERSIWPSIYRLLAAEISQHRSTIVFANNRRTVERLTSMLNEELSGDPATASAEPQVRAHHGSVSLEMRQQTEQALKEGRLRAVVATASLELGIDMGAVELVCQVESPGSVSRGLQRVGRAGHLVGQESKGRLIPKMLPDLVNQAVLAAEMMAGHVEPLKVPQNCLDILAQQVVAMAAMETWKVDDLFRVVRQAYPFRDLTPQAFDSVLEMVTGRFRFQVDDEETPKTNPATQMTALQPRVSWDRTHGKLRALPGSQGLALLNGGTIPDSGQFAVVTRRGLRLGELDEEFVFERRVGDTFTLGTNSWRIDKIDLDRVIVLPAEGAPAMTPFWRGEQTGRTFDLGLAQGAFLRTLTERIDEPGCLDWLERDHFLDRNAARNVRDYVKRQVLRAGVVPSDRTFLIEASRDPLGDWQVILLTPLGARFHLTLRLALENLLRRRLGYRPQCMHHDDGLLLRLTDSDEPLLDLFAGLDSRNLRRFVLEELADSALFALRFRHNAARALLMPRSGTGKRAPLWLQRLRGRDLLQVAKRYADFPIVAETLRECLQDSLDVSRVERVLEDIESGAIEIKTVRLDMPSPFGAGLLLAYQAAFLYGADEVEATPSGGQIDEELLDQLLGRSGPTPPDDAAVLAIDRRLRGVGLPPRSPQEMAERLRLLGDMADDELEGPMAGFVAALASEGQAARITIAGVSRPERWILVEEADDYRRVFSDETGPERTKIAGRILHRFLETHALVGLDDVLARYPFERRWAQRQIETWTKRGRLVPVPRGEGDHPPQWATPTNFQQMQRTTLALRRREVVSCPPARFVDFVLRWQHLTPGRRLRGLDGAEESLQQLRGVTLPADLWERTILPFRVADCPPRVLDSLPGWLWFGRGPGLVGMVEREELAGFTPAVVENVEAPLGTEVVREALERRGALFVADLAQMTSLPPSVVRHALWALVQRGLVTNDRFEVARRGEPVAEPAPQAGLRRRTGTRRGVDPEGRWSLIPWPAADVALDAVAAARRLLDRYGIVARELAKLDPTIPPWRVLYEVLSRMELADEVRRGYFVEGLSGAQFALPDAARMLHDLAGPTTSTTPVTLIHTLDPANLHASGGPFDPVAETNRTFLRRPGNWIALQAGVPVLLVEQHGKRLTAMPNATPETLAAAVAELPRRLPASTGDLRQRITVETWNDGPVTSSAGKSLLEAAGFVRDYQAMTWFAAWGSLTPSETPTGAGGDAVL
jgi:ATP-dependent helicase Lhr and Lhr-like helicase